LKDVGAVKLNDPRLTKEDEEVEEISKTIKSSKPGVSMEDDDSDWD
jgi:hypothetical protein